MKEVDRVRVVCDIVCHISSYNPSLRTDCYDGTHSLSLSLSPLVSCYLFPDSKNSSTPSDCSSVNFTEMNLVQTEQASIKLWHILQVANICINAKQ